MFLDSLMMPQNTETSKSEAIAYRDRLNTWAIARLLPNLQRTVVARFRSRSDAEGHLQRLKQLIPQASFILVFDDQLESNKPDH
jgi:hypothetical protein